MGRPERNVNADSGPVARFACDLRALRQAAGSPSYRQLAAKANYSATVLSRAASGRELPSLPVVLAYVTACGGDVDEWRERWLSLAGRPEPRVVGEDPAERTEDGSAGPDDQAGSEDQPASASQAGARTVVTRSRVLLAGLAVLITAATTAAIVFAVAGPGRPPAATPGTSASRTPSTRPTASHVTPSDGKDPTAAGCVADALSVASADLRLGKAVIISGKPRPAGTEAGVVELIYSASCHAAWTRVAPVSDFAANSVGWANVKIVRPSDGTYEGFRSPTITIVYGNILLTNHGCLIASASFHFRNGADAYAATPCWSKR